MSCIVDCERRVLRARLRVLAARFARVCFTLSPAFSKRVTALRFHRLTSASGERLSHRLPVRRDFPTPSNVYNADIHARLREPFHIGVVW
jgi:hypothetical protein